jgi:hypothetical protein
MRATRSGWVRALGVLAAALALVATACAGSTGAGSDEPSSSEISASLQEVLSRDNLEVVGASFEGGLSAEETLEAFGREYDPEKYKATPVAYSVEIVSSDEMRLEPASKVRMVHVAGVPQEVEGPAPEEGSEPSVATIETDMFAFFDAQTGGHLATVYIGPPGPA